MTARNNHSAGTGRGALPRLVALMLVGMLAGCAAVPSSRSPAGRFGDPLMTAREMYSSLKTMERMALAGQSPDDASPEEFLEMNEAVMHFHGSIGVMHFRAVHLGGSGLFPRDWRGYNFTRLYLDYYEKNTHLAGVPAGAVSYLAFVSLLEDEVTRKKPRGLHRDLLTYRASELVEGLMIFLRHTKYKEALSLNDKLDGIRALLFAQGCMETYVAPIMALRPEELETPDPSSAWVVTKVLNYARSHPEEVRRLSAAELAFRALDAR